MLDIVGIKTPEGYYIGGLPQGYYSANLSEYIVDGEKPKKTFEEGWYLVSKEPTKITKPVRPKQENYRYELIDPSLASNAIPLMIPKGDATHVGKDEDGDDTDFWNQKYYHIQSLYRLVWDDVPQPDMDVEFTYNTILETDDLKVFKELPFTGYHDRNVSANELVYQLIDKIRFPSIYYKSHCPVTCPSTVLYSIIRNYIKKNIDLTVAAVTSDYDFCFTVTKYVVRKDPIYIRKEIKNRSGRSYSNPRFVNVEERTAGKLDVFKMTNGKDRYSGYPVLPALTANNSEELEKKIDDILNKLMEFINTPFVLCATCNGNGMLHDVKPMDLNALLNGEENGKV